MKGYVVPRPGTAEDAALKRLAIKGATGVVAKVRYISEIHSKLCFAGPASRCFLGAARGGFYPGRQLPRSERLCSPTPRYGRRHTLVGFGNDGRHEGTR